MPSVAACGPKAIQRLPTDCPTVPGFCWPADRAIVEEFDRRALGDHLAQRLDVPIGQPDAAVQLGLAHLFGVRRAVNAVARDAQVDPDRAHRIVRASRDGELLLRLDLLPGELRIVLVDRVRCDSLHFVHAARGWIVLTADRNRIERDQLAVLVENAQRAFGLVDLDLGSLRCRALLRHVRHDNLALGLAKRFTRIERLEQVLRHVKFFRKQFARARIGQMIQLGHFLQALRNLLHERSFHVRAGDLVFDQHGIGRGGGELRPGRLVELAGPSRPFCRWKAVSALA